MPPSAPVQTSVTDPAVYLSRLRAFANAIDMKRKVQNPLSTESPRQRIFIANPQGFLVLSYAVTAESEDIYHDLKQLLEEMEASFKQSPAAPTEIIQQLKQKFDSEFLLNDFECIIKESCEGITRIKDIAVYFDTVSCCEGRSLIFVPFFTLSFSCRLLNWESDFS